MAACTSGASARRSFGIELFMQLLEWRHNRRLSIVVQRSAERLGHLVVAARQHAVGSLQDGVGHDEVHVGGLCGEKPGVEG